MDFSNIKFVVVGAGFFGSTVAERIAGDLGKQVLLLDRRAHIGGNSYSEVDPETGIEFHAYGSHIFHTQNESIWRYVNRFSTFNSYMHHVWTTTQGQVYPMPIHLATMNLFYKKSFSPSEAREFLALEIARDAIAQPQNLEEQAVSLIGRPLYDAFIAGYTAKQWETDPKLLPASIITRLPVRFDYDGRYFGDPYQGIPLDGYGSLFRRMLSHPLIDIQLGVDFFDIRALLPQDCLIVYTGPIDRYFNDVAGKLSWRTIDLKRDVAMVPDYQGTSVMNYADKEVPFTRIHEFRHFHPERRYQQEKTLIFREYSRFAQNGDEPYYPINQEFDKKILAAYMDLKEKEQNVYFGGRLGSYKYLDMHQAIGAALVMYEREIKPRVTGEAWVRPSSVLPVL